MDTMIFAVLLVAFIFVAFFIGCHIASIKGSSGQAISCICVVAVFVIGMATYGLFDKYKVPVAEEAVYDVYDINLTQGRSEESISYAYIDGDTIKTGHTNKAKMTDGKSKVVRTKYQWLFLTETYEDLYLSSTEEDAGCK